MFWFGPSPWLCTIIDDVRHSFTGMNHTEVVVKLAAVGLNNCLIDSLMNWFLRAHRLRLLQKNIFRFHWYLLWCETKKYCFRQIQFPKWRQAHTWCRNFLNTLRPRQNGRHFPDDVFKSIFVNENVWISIKISLKFVPKGPINNIPALVQIMAWRRPGDKPLYGPMMVRLPTHICVTRPQWLTSCQTQLGMSPRVNLQSCGGWQ